MEVRPLRTEQDYGEALAAIDELLDAEEGSADFDRLDILSVLVEKYEEEHHAIEAPEPIAAIEFAMEQRGLTRKDLEQWIGSRARVAEVLNRRRPLSINMIRALHDALGIPAEVLIQKVKTTKAKSRRSPARATRSGSKGAKKKTKG